MTYVHVCRLFPSCQCLVCLASCRSSPQGRQQSESGQMLSKTILIGLSIFRFGREKSIHGRPSWEFTKHCNEDFATWCKLVRNAASMIAMESAEWFDLQHNFLFWTRPKHSLLDLNRESNSVIYMITGETQ